MDIFNVVVAQTEIQKKIKPYVPWICTDVSFLGPILLLPKCKQTTEYVNLEVRLCHTLNWPPQFVIHMLNKY